MKKLFLVLAAAFAMVACQTDINEVGVVAGGEVDVTFEVGTPTRAYSDGTTATVLQYAVYEGETELTALTRSLEGNNPDTINISKTVNFKLVTGNTYTAIFWAAAPNAPYTVNFGGNLANAAVSVDYTNALSNDENRDAFFKRHDFTVRGTQTETIELRRPFAQLNIGTNDYLAAKDAGYEPTLSAVTVKNIYNTLNLWDGAVSNEEEVTYKYTNIPAGETFPVAGYEYLAMNYILVGSDKELVTVKLSYLDDDRQEHERTYTAVPVQRNWRTNIYGNILTSETDFTVTIVPGFNEPDHNIEVWDGKTTEEPKITENTENPGEVVAEITNGAQLAWIAQMLNGTVNNARTTRSGEEVDYSEMTIKLGANIDLGNEQWTSIGTSENPFSGKLEGNGYTISNLKIVETEGKEGKAYVGFFGYAKDVAINDVTFDNVDINIACLDIDHSQGHIGAVVGSLEGASTIENVTVKGDIKVEATFDANGASRVAVVAGGNTFGDVTMKNVKVEAKEGSYLKANNNVGALAGQLQGKSVFKDCSSNISVTGTKFFAGGIIGLAAGDQTFTNCHTTGNITITAGREGRHNDEYRVGGIAGGWADGKTKVCTLTNCSYTGAVSGKNADGADAEPLDYAGYVGRGYTLANCAGSKVVIDDVEYVQVFDNLYGVYSVNGVTILNNDAQFEQALASGMTEINLGEGEFNLPMGLTQKEGTLTITGSGSDKTTLLGARNENASHPGNYANGVALVFNDLKFVTANNGYNGGFGHAESVTFRNSAIIGQFYAHSAAPHYFYDCTIDPMNGYLYTYSSDCVFEGCTFKASEGKALQIYADANSGEQTVTITDCAFKAAKHASTWDGKPVTGIDINSNGTTFNVYINNTTTEGFPVGLNSGNNLWNVKDGGKAYANVYVDDVQVWYAGCDLYANGLFKKGNEYIVVNANGLVALSKTAINGGESVKLGANIDLKDVEFNGFSAFNPENNNTFDGQNYTVSNWTYNGGASDMGFIKSWTGTIQNIKFENCHLKTAGRSAVVAAKVYANIENVIVNNCSIEDSYWACGIIAGLYNSGSINNCTVTNSSVKANGGTGGIVGVINETGGERAVMNCSVTGSTIHNTGAYGADYPGGGIVGMLNADNATYKFINCTVSGNGMIGNYNYKMYPTNDNVVTE